MRRHYHDYTVGWICALPIELAAAQEMLDEEHETLPPRGQDENLYALGSISGHNIAIVSLPAGQVGSSLATMAVTQMRETFPVMRFALMVGIGGGVPSAAHDIRLGDVIISQPNQSFGGVVQYDFGKTTKKGFIRTGSLNAPPTLLLNAAAKLRSNYARARGDITKYLSVLTSCLPDFGHPEVAVWPDRLFLRSYEHADDADDCSKCDPSYEEYRPSRGHDNPIIHYGTIASGNQVMRDGTVRDLVSTELGGVLCFEMEAAGLMNLLPCLVIRGISDYADSHKGDPWQSYAAATASACAKELLSLIPASETSKLPPEGVNISKPPFDRDERFVGRGEVLRELDRQLSCNARVALAGIGGVGKTQIAIEYCYRVQEQDPHLNVLWVHASNRDRFLESFRKIGRGLGLHEYEDAKTDILELVHDRLSDDGHGPWLMVLDNADDIGIFFDTQMDIPSNMETKKPLLLRYLPRSNNGKMIITTRDSRVGERLARQGSCIAVPTLSKQEAQSLLRTYASYGNRWTEDSVTMLVEELDCLPLAITQAAAFISENHCNLEDYLEMFHSMETEELDILSEDIPDPRRDIESRSSVVRTWKLSFDVIKRQKPQAAAMLAIIAVLDGQGIPRSVLRSEYSTTRDFILSIGILQSFSLVHGQDGGNSFVMHRLVQLCVRSWLKTENTKSAYEAVTIRMISSSFPSGEYENWDICANLLPHAKQVLRYAPQSEGDRLLFAALSHNVASYDWRQGRYGSAYKASKEAYEIRRDSLGDDSKETIDSCAMLALILRDQGEIDKSEVFHKQVVEKHEKLLGKDHVDTIMSTSRLAELLRIQGKYVEAEELITRLLQRSEIILGKEHENTLAIMSGLAVVLQAQGKYQEAELRHAQVLENRKKALGEKHPSTLDSASNLALSMLRGGKFTEAEALSRQVLKDRELIFGKDHPETLTSVCNLALLLRDQGKYEEAEVLHRQDLEGSERILGRGHPETLISVNNLAVTLQMRGKYKEAEMLHRRDLEGSIKVLGEDHPDTLFSVNNLASALQYQGNYEEAEILNRQTLEKRQLILGKDHPDTLTTMNNLASVLLHQSRLEEADALIRSALAIGQETLGEAHPDTLETLSNLVLVLHNQSKLEEAELLSRKILVERQENIGALHPQTLKTMTNLASVLLDRGKYEEAEVLSLQTLQQREFLLGNEHPDTLKSLEIVLRAMRCQGKHYEAEEIEKSQAT